MSPALRRTNQKQKTSLGINCMCIASCPPELRSDSYKKKEAIVSFHYIFIFIYVFWRTDLLYYLSAEYNHFFPARTHIQSSLPQLQPTQRH